MKKEHRCIRERTGEPNGEKLFSFNMGSVKLAGEEAILCSDKLNLFELLCGMLTS